MAVPEPEGTTVGGGEATPSEARGVLTYGLGDFRLSDLASCGAELRRVGSNAGSFEEVAQHIIHTLHNRFVNPSTGRRSFVLARLFLCMPYDRLNPELQAHVRSLRGEQPLSPELKCLALMASVGDKPVWNSRFSSRNHRVLPLASVESVERAPMLAQLLTQLGFDLSGFVQPASDLIVARQQTTYNVFHVPEARNSPYLPDQAGFVGPHGVRSVLGLGGVLPPDNMFSIILFSRDPISERTAAIFKPLAISIKIAAIPFAHGPIFVTMPKRVGSPGSSSRGEHPEESATPLEPMVVALRQLVESQDEAVAGQARELEQALEDLRRRAGDLDRVSQDLRSILDSMTDGVVVADTEGRFLEFNPSAERILGVGRKDVPPTEWAQEYNLFLADGTTLYPMEQLPLWRATHGQEVNGEVMCLRRGESVEAAWISVNARPLRDRTGALRGGVAVFRDITARVKSERLVRRLSNAVEEAADPIFMTERDGKIVYVNPAFERVTGYPREEALGETPRILRSGRHNVAFYKRMWDTILGGDVFRGATVNRRKSGEIFHAESTITPIKDTSGRVDHFVALVKDMTERRAAEARETEMRLGAVVQKKLYPRSSPTMANCDVAGEVFPATELCGDYFDYIDMGNGEKGIAIGDVSGHGLGSALVMADTRAYLRCLTHESTDLGLVFARMNDLLIADLTDSQFVSLLMVRLDPVRRRLSYCNAGHDAGYILTAAGEVKTVLKSTNVPLGMFARREYSSSESIDLDPGDLLLLLTDGVSESGPTDENFFGEERSLETVREHLDESAEAIVRHILSTAREFAGHRTQQDDMTVVVCKLG